jgi:hypothetical protein
MRVVLQDGITKGVGLCQRRRLQKQFRVNRRSIVWLAPRCQGHYEKTAQTINSPFFVPPLTTFRYAGETGD